MRDARPPDRRGLVAAGIALLARLAVGAWARGAIPPAADGTYYQTFATRLAAGEGYTWAWPDGAVTYAAHFPVGYPAIVALGYAVFGAHPVVAMVVNALLGAAASLAVYTAVAPLARGDDGARAGGGDRRAFVAAMLVGLHPALVPYTAALMTESVTASLLAIAAALSVKAARGRSWSLWATAAVVVGIATLVRPQSVVLAPVLGALAWPRGATSARRALGALGGLAIALGVCAPWTARNCARMNRCALASVNAGWNLLIGQQTENGAWQEIVVPAECAQVWDEAEKDMCFERAAKRAIRGAPAAWAAKIPAKLGTTFDYFGAAPWYLHQANAEAFPERAKIALGAIETVASRLALIAALLALGARPGPRRGARLVVSLVGVAFTCTPYGWVAYLTLAGVALLAPAVGEGLLFVFGAAVILSTAATHAAFFGAGRYGLVVVPFVTAFAALLRPKDVAGALRWRQGRPETP